MGIHAAVIRITEENAPSAFRKAIRTPFLTWMAESLRKLSISRIVLECPASLQEEAKACIPEDMLHKTVEDLKLLPQCSSCGGKEILVLPEPCVYLPGEEFTDADSSAYTVSRSKLGFSAPEDRTPFVGFVPAPEKELFGPFALFLCSCKLAELEAGGAVIWDWDHTYVGPSVQIGEGTELLPGCILYGKTNIGSGCTIGPNTLMESASVGSGVTVNSSQLYQAKVGDKTTVGPFAYLRPDSVVGSECRVGDFVEVKNSNIGNGTKISHLTYVGDSDVGERVNFGCGTVTVNYDRVHKYRTVIGDDCFIGCNTNLVAPVTLGSNVYTAAGSTITSAVPADALAVARAHQKNIENWSKENKQKVKK